MAETGSAFLHYPRLTAACSTAIHCHSSINAEQLLSCQRLCKGFPTLLTAALWACRYYQLCHYWR